MARGWISGWEKRGFYRYVQKPNWPLLNPVLEPRTKGECPYYYNTDTFEGEHVVWREYCTGNRYLCDTCPKGQV